ncbi:Bacteriocin-protection, YdeI or OmpD-Associated [Tenacibaculum sp. MAR_2009_124]|uniref:YdeI/OmpD-associated family protein n=1 Tax=Tenacibaculum sp. MAR_2009_124 TaxID=1250059 RepID=UPI00089B878C|nr:YdeI/OmpD-associated family protein [Tenacibaculum sp. MAR_2009_124]SEB35236.1 Bacteriocin-protection, YdeI or OmpD-Associated [Tenacibaculum sp. MAR_2009_124]
MTKKHLVNAEYLLQKFPGKGGWTYAEIPEISQNKNNPFGWVKVKGSIDTFSLKQYKLMPMGNGKLFLPVKAAIRKVIKKEAGDYVHITLDIDTSSIIIPNEIMACFDNEPKQTLTNFLAFSEGQQKTYLDWVYNVKTNETKAKRILEMMNKVFHNLKKEDNIQF